MLSFACGKQWEHMNEDLEVPPRCNLPYNSMLLFFAWNLKFDFIATSDACVFITAAQHNNAIFYLYGKSPFIRDFSAPGQLQESVLQLVWFLVSCIKHPAAQQMHADAMELNILPTT